MNHTEQRKRLRALLAGPRCLSPASIHDPLSARVAEATGYELGLLSGSVASATLLAAPDLLVYTLTEYADLIRRIMRVSRMSLLSGIDYGYGNALNVMRAVQEFEHAGVSALGIEDVEGPLSFGQAEDEQKLSSVEEAVGKLRAAVAARSDPSLVIIARTPALKIEGIEGMIARAKAYAAAGVDMIHVAAKANLDEIRAVHSAAKLPIIAGGGNEMLKREELAACGVRIMMQGHQPLAAAVKALYGTYTHLFNGGAPADLKSKIASAEEMENLVNADSYKRWLREYMH